MSYSEWANFVYYKTGDIATYNTTPYQALQPNVDVVPTGLAPNWVVLPSGGGGGVSSLSGGTGALTQSCLNGTYSLVGNNIELAIAYPVVPPVVPQEFPYYGIGATSSFAVSAGGTEQIIGNVKTTYTMSVNRPKCLYQVYYYANGTMDTTGGNDLFLVGGTLSLASGNPLVYSLVSKSSIYVDNINKPTGFDSVVIFEVDLAAGSDTILCDITGQSTLTSDAYTINATGGVGLLQITT